MNTTLRQRLIHAAITAVTLSAVMITAGCEDGADAPESGIPQTHVTVVPPPVHKLENTCRVASAIADYVVRYEDGNEVYVTPREDVRVEAWMVADGMTTPAQNQAMCRKVVRQATKDGTTAAGKAAGRGRA